jgi:hypothetical protein
MRYFILVDRKPVATHLMAWAEWLQKSQVERIVAQTGMGDITVSTVFIGLNHNMAENPPLIFETMIFGGELDGYTKRTSTWEQAETAHHEACLKTADGCEALKKLTQLGIERAIRAIEGL